MNHYRLHVTEKIDPKKLYKGDLVLVLDDYKQTIGQVDADGHIKPLALSGVDLDALANATKKRRD